MDTTEVAGIIGTSPRIFRQFLRSPMSTFAAVGSGARYEFNQSELATLQKRFSEWQGAGKPKPANAKPTTRTTARKDKTMIQREKDLKVWEEEEATGGFPTLEDIRDPRVRARVLRDAQAAEDRLNLRLLATGQHITQGRIDATRRAS